MKILLFSFGLCTGLFILAACATSPNPQGVGSDLTSPVWGLTMLMDKALAPGSGITVQFTPDGKLSGLSGCNRYVGTYNASGITMKISSPLASTIMACSQEIMDQENAYLTTLGEVKTYTFAGDQLTLNDANHKSILVYKAQSQDLSSTSWKVIGYNNGKQSVSSVLVGTTLTAEFAKDGTLSGSGGCNNYNGTYTVTGNQIKIGPLASTKMACGEPEGVMEQESQYMVALQTAVTFQIEGTILELRTADGALVVDASASTATTSTNLNQGILWQWLNVTNQSTDKTTTVPNPENYTITFNADGTLEGKADCNSFSGTYSQDNGFIITLGASTMAYCGDTSLDQQYLTLLGSVVAGGPDGTGGLALENAGGEQRMLFTNGGTTTK